MEPYHGEAVELKRRKVIRMRGLASNKPSRRRALQVGEADVVAFLLKPVVEGLPAVLCLHRHQGLLNSLHKILEALEIFGEPASFHDLSVIWQTVP